MYLTQSNVIREDFPKQEYTMLREMCQYSNNLYNVARLYDSAALLDTQQFLRYEENYPICKESGTMVVTGRCRPADIEDGRPKFSFFFGLLQKVKSGDYGSKVVCLPYYREKGRSLQSHLVDERYYH